MVGPRTTSTPLRRASTAATAPYRRAISGPRTRPSAVADGRLSDGLALVPDLAAHAGGAVGDQHAAQADLLDRPGGPEVAPGEQLHLLLEGRGAEQLGEQGVGVGPCRGAGAVEVSVTVTLSVGVGRRRRRPSKPSSSGFLTAYPARPLPPDATYERDTPCDRVISGISRRGEGRAARPGGGRQGWAATKARRSSRRVAWRTGSARGRPGRAAGCRGAPGGR